MHQPRAKRVPISVVTGFLGSGKTTLVNQLVQHPGLARTLIIVNELGEIGLDHDLVEEATDDVVLLQSGCLCCSVRSDLIETLTSVALKAERGEIPSLNRVLIETTGLADPGPILQAFMTQPAVTGRFDVDGVITTVDAVNGYATVGRHPEAVKQAAVADRILLTKTDIAEPAATSAVEQRLRVLNPGAPIITTVFARDFDPALLFDIGPHKSDGNLSDVRRWLASAEAPGGTGEHAAEAHPHDHGSPPTHHRSVHDERIRTISMSFDEPIPGEVLDRWLRSLLRLRGPDLLRFKAIVNVAELPRPMVLHGVQHVIHPPLMLKDWPSEDRRTRMVFITYDIDESALRSSFREFTSEGADKTLA